MTRTASQPPGHCGGVGRRRRGSPQPLLPDPQELPPAQVPAAAAGGDSAFLAKRPDLLCSRNYEKNVCRELSCGRPSEGPGLKAEGPTQGCMASGSRGGREQG